MMYLWEYEDRYSYIDNNTPTDVSLTNSNADCTDPLKAFFLDQNQYTGAHEQAVDVLACSDPTEAPTVFPTQVSLANKVRS